MILSNPPAGLAAALEALAQRPDVTDLLPRIDVPTLVICGRDDQISPAREMRAIAEAIPGAVFVEIPSAGHMAPMENSAAVNGAIRQFLDGVALQ
jgi:pimeloyl-ACP methyl ester carboxylesterase